MAIMNHMIGHRLISIRDLDIETARRNIKRHPKIREKLKEIYFELEEILGVVEGSDVLP